MFKKVITKIDGYKVAKVESEDGFTMFLEDMNGGPIISNMDEKTCRKDFKEALGLMESVIRLMNFKRTGKFEMTKLTNFKNNG